MEGHVVRTAATLQMTAFPSVDCRKRGLSVLVTTVVPRDAARFADTNRFPLGVRCRLKPM